MSRAENRRIFYNDVPNTYHILDACCSRGRNIRKPYRNNFAVDTKILIFKLWSIVRVSPIGIWQVLLL